MMLDQGMQFQIPMMMPPPQVSPNVAAEAAMEMAVAAAMKTNMMSGTGLSAGMQPQAFNAAIPGPNREVLLMMQGNGKRQRPTPVCIFWYQAACAKGNNCVFAHPASHFGGANPKPQLEVPPHVSSKASAPMPEALENSGKTTGAQSMPFPGLDAKLPPTAPLSLSTLPMASNGSLQPGGQLAGSASASAPAPVAMLTTGASPKPGMTVASGIQNQVAPAVDRAAVSELSFLAASQSNMDEQSVKPKEKPSAPSSGYAAARASVMGRPSMASQTKREQTLKGVFDFRWGPKTQKPVAATVKDTPTPPSSSHPVMSTESTNVIIILGLPLEIAEAAVLSECSKHGDVYEVIVTQGSAVVTFASNDMATNAIKHMNGTILLGAPGPLQVDFFNEAEVRQRAKEHEAKDQQAKVTQEDKEPQLKSSRDEKPKEPKAKEERERSRDREKEKKAPKDDRSSKDDEPRRRSFRDRSRSRSRSEKRRDDSPPRRRTFRDRSRSRSPRASQTSSRPEPTVKKRAGSKFDVGPDQLIPASDIPPAPGASKVDPDVRQIAARGSWAQYMNNDGKTYFYNVTTKVTQWEKPHLFEVAPSRRAGDVVSGVIASQPGETNLFLFNLPVHWVEQDILQHFTPFGRIVRSTVSRGGNGISKGYGFCAFESYESAQVAIANMNGFHIDGKILKVSLKSVAGTSTKASKA
eukprot:gnl/MRDRNA2_/MRDRNA2_78715_c0_seq1.p1 gnl/MRDRNA2_/MRDRNA2_78715_c0~~gnl/MRDRNA2_/MRDRNA2_78715_c0_seq1.p1  ORF type:complete len:693 (+),score=160.97 gnl/MRDRNA2_/MRDRNA2_78715_c0_seq1:206-2284(+)